MYCELCRKVVVEELEFYCSSCRSEIFKIIEDERKGIKECNPKLNKEYGCINALKKLDFGFSLGYKPNEIFFGGNCKRWTNAFHCNPTSFKAVFEVINYHESFSTQLQKSIENKLKMYPNKLFLCKDRDTSVIEWHYYPYYDPYKQINIPFSYNPELKELVRLNE